MVAIANPNGLDEYELHPVDVDGELKRAKAALGDIPTTELASEGSATLSRIADAARGSDVLYLVCHGGLVEDQAALWLEDPGTADHCHPLARVTVTASSTI